MPPVAVYEVATFYAMYNRQPVGKYKITICTNLPCALQDAVKAAEHLKEKLGIGFGETTPDGLVTLQEGECIGACGDAPVLLVNNKRMCSWMRPDKLDALLAELRAAPARQEVRDERRRTASSTTAPTPSSWRGSPARTGGSRTTSRAAATRR